MLKNLTIFDADFLLWSATHGNKVLDSDGNPIRENNKFVYTDKSLEECFKASDDIIINILDKLSTDYFCGFLGASKSFRMDIYPDYKANRKNLVKPVYIREVKDYLYSAWKFTPSIEGLEADDAVNITKNNLKDDFNITVVSSDKDLTKCIKGTYLNPRDLSMIETSEKDARIFFWKSMIVGDFIDNIKGIPGKGEVYANNLVSFCEEHHTDYPMEVLDRYIKHFGEEEGIEEFRKNYKCLKILDKFRTFESPTLQSWELSITKSSELDWKELNE